MSHVRQQIREAAALLLTGLATTGARVFQSRLHPLRDADLPCLLVNTDDEQIETQGIGSHPLQERTLNITIRAISKASDSLDDTLDTMISEVETALSGQTFGGLASGLVIESIGIEMNDDLEKPVGVASVIYSATYYTAAGSPGTAI